MLTDLQVDYHSDDVGWALLDSSVSSCDLPGLGSQSYLGFDLLHISLILFKPAAIGPSSCHDKCQEHRCQVQLCNTVKPFVHIVCTNISLAKWGNLIKPISGLGCILCLRRENTNCPVHYRGLKNQDQWSNLQTTVFQWYMLCLCLEMSAPL